MLVGQSFPALTLQAEAWNPSANMKHEEPMGHWENVMFFFPYVFQVRLRWRVQSLAFRWEIASLVVAFLELMPPEAQLNMCRWCNPNINKLAATCVSQWCFRYIHLPIFWDVTGIIHHSNHRSLSPCSSGVVVPSWQVMKMPDDMAFESAAALPTVVLTALHAVNLVPTSISSVAYRFCIQESIDSFQHFIKMVQVLYRCCICFDMLLFLRWILWNPHLRCESTKAGAPELLGRGPWPWNIVSKVL